MVPTGAIGYAPGKIGNAATCSGTGTNYLNCATSVQPLNWAGGFTVTGWFLVPTAFTASFCPWSRGYAVNALSISSLNSQLYRLYDTGGSSIDAEMSTSLSVDTWYYYAIGYNPATKKIFLSLNGGARTISASALANGPANPAAGMDMIRRAANYGACHLDVTKLWMRYLSDDEIAMDYNGGDGLDYPF